MEHISSNPWGFPCGSAGKDSTYHADPGLIPGWGISSGGGNGNPLQYFCLGIPWTEEPAGLQCVGWPRVGHDCVTPLFPQTLPPVTLSRGWELVTHLWIFALLSALLPEVTVHSWRLLS